MTASEGRSFSFTQLQRDMKATVVAIHNRSTEAVRLQEMGLTVGTTFRVIKVAPFGDPIEIELRGYRLCLRKRETDGFELQLAA